MMLFIAFTLLPLQGETSVDCFTPTCRFALRRAVCRLPLRGVSCRSITSKQSSLNSTCKSKHNFAHFDRKVVFFGLKAQKHLARGRA